MATEKRSPEPGPQLVTVPADLKVEIRDERAADVITPEGMRAYMLGQEWQVVRDDGDRQTWERWPPGSMFVPQTVMVPMATDYADYRRKVLDVVRALAKYEGRGQLAVWANLREASREGDGDEG